MEEFRRDLGITYRCGTPKPQSGGFSPAMDQGTDPAHTAMLGDKLLTDMLGANLGVTALMVEPAGGQDPGRVLHALQAPGSI